jgi:mono/diheme cytochrome c family protein
MVRHMDAADIELRNATYRLFIELGRAPTAAEVAGAIGRPESDVRDGWRRLHDAHAIVLDSAGDIRMANPFSAVATPFQVEAAGKHWNANCAWDAFGIGAALHVDSVIDTECADCHQPIRLHVRDGRPNDTDLVFHVLVPAISWWQDIGFT